MSCGGYNGLMCVDGWLYTRHSHIIIPNDRAPCPYCKGVQKVESTSDDRVKNNVMRHTYRVLSDEEKINVEKVKDAGYDFVRLLHTIGGTVTNFDGLPPRVNVPQASRDLALSQTAIEEAVMWAVKHITK